MLGQQISHYHLLRSLGRGVRAGGSAPAPPRGWGVRVFPCTVAERRRGRPAGGTSDAGGRVGAAVVGGGVGA